MVVVDLHIKPNFQLCSDELLKLTKGSILNIQSSYVQKCVELRLSWGFEAQKCVTTQLIIVVSCVVIS